MTNFLAFIAIVVAIIIGVTQLKEGRAYICDHISVLCDRSNSFRLYSIDYIGSQHSARDGSSGEWPIFRPLTSSSVIDSNCSQIDLSTLKIDDDPSTDGQILSKGSERWLFRHIAENALFEPNRGFAFFFETSQSELKRNVTLYLDVKVKLDGADEPSSSRSYRIELPERSTKTKAFCLLPIAGIGFNEFQFEVEDDAWHSDDPVKVGFVLHYLKLRDQPQNSEQRR